MIIKKGLVNQSKSFIKNNLWYHQRFDASPQFLLLISDAELMREPRKFSWGHFSSHWSYYANDCGDWYIEINDINRITGKFIKLTKNDSAFSKKIMKKWNQDEKKFYQYCRFIDTLRLRDLSNEELKKIYSEMLNRSIRALSFSSLIDGFALGSDNYILESLKKFLRAKGMESQLQRYFSILTAPVHQSFMAEAEIKLLKIGQQIIKIPSLHKVAIKSRLKEIEKIIKDYPKIDNLLRKYRENFFWIRNNYVDNRALPVKFFLKELVALLKGQVNLGQEINRLSLTPKTNQSVKQKLLKKLSLPDDLKNLLTVSEDFTHWQDQRKKKTYWYAYYLGLMLEEVSRRFDFSIHQLKYFHYPEILDLFDHKTRSWPTKQEVNLRIKACVWFQKAKFFDSLAGIKANKLKDYLLKQNKQKKMVDDFRGMAASKGVAKGPVRIVKSVKECHKVKSGDVIVAVMTRPDYVPAMKKAAAVVTNEGGVTCHAAIVSRELGIPCVIGTKIATEVLKDGMMVEVNANHGVVKIIKNKQ